MRCNEQPRDFLLQEPSKRTGSAVSGRRSKTDQLRTHAVRHRFTEQHPGADFFGMSQVPSTTAATSGIATKPNKVWKVMIDAMLSVSPPSCRARM